MIIYEEINKGFPISTIPNIWYHRTTEEKWKLIQEEGVLWGIPSTPNYPRYTYLSPYDLGKSYGDILLEVEYKPLKETQGYKHNYGFEPPEGQICWQFSVFEPIDIKNVKVVKSIEKTEVIWTNYKIGD